MTKKFSHKINIFAPLAAAIMIFISGCGPKMVPLQICPGKPAAEEAIKSLNNNSGKIRPFRSYGRCLAKVNIEKKIHKEDFAVKLWFEPPENFRLFGDIAFDGRGLDIGCNKDEFWFAARPKELGSTYIWGNRSDVNQQVNLRINPQVFLAAFGKINAENNTDWLLTHKGPFDILTQYSDSSPLQKIYIYCCDYTIRKIEYFSAAGAVTTTVEFDEYKNFFGDVVLPSIVKITYRSEDGTVDSFKVTVDTVKAFEFTPTSRSIYFQRPQKLTGFKNVFKLVDGQFVEQAVSSSNLQLQ